MDKSTKAALEREAEGYRRSGQTDRLKQVEKQLGKTSTRSRRERAVSSDAETPEG